MFRMLYYGNQFLPVSKTEYCIISIADITPCGVRVALKRSRNHGFASTIKNIRLTNHSSPSRQSQTISTMPIDLKPRVLSRGRE